MFRNAAQRLMINLQVLDIQLMTQETILEEAMDSAVLEGEPEQTAMFAQPIERKRQ